MNEYLAETTRNVRCDDLYHKIAITEDNLNAFIGYMDSFDALKDDWNEWFQLAQNELEACVACKANTLEEMSENLDRIQVGVLVTRERLVS